MRGDQRGDALPAAPSPAVPRTPPTAVATSRLPVGSSASSTCGALASARAIATRCCSPPDSLPGRCPARARQPERRQQRHRAFRRGLARLAGDHLRQHDILQRGELAEQMMELIDEADRVAADRGARRVGQRAGVAALDKDRAAVRLLQQSREMQQRRFAGARTARPERRSRPPAASGRRRAAPEARRPRCDRSGARRAGPADSLMPQRLDRVGPRGAPARIQRRQQRQHQRHHDDLRHFAPVQPRGQVRQMKTSGLNTEAPVTPPPNAGWSRCCGRTPRRSGCRAACR